jgi:hypothetical protein
MRPTTTLVMVIILLALIGAAVAQLVFGVGGGAPLPTSVPAKTTVVAVLLPTTIDAATAA